MDKDLVLQKLKIILHNNYTWISKEKEILPGSKLREDLELDSLGMVNLQVAVEDEFDIRFDPIETDLSEIFKTVESLSEFIQNRS